MKVLPLTPPYPLSPSHSLGLVPWEQQQPWKKPWEKWSCLEIFEYFQPKQERACSNRCIIISFSKASNSLQDFVFEYDKMCLDPKEMKPTERFNVSAWSVLMCKREYIFGVHITFFIHHITAFSLAGRISEVLLLMYFYRFTGYSFTAALGATHMKFGDLVSVFLHIHSPLCIELLLPSLCWPASLISKPDGAQDRDTALQIVTVLS